MIKANMKPNHIENFWNKVNKDEDNKCWEWLGDRYPRGYGHLASSYEDQYAHRLSWMIHYGEIPSGFCVLHHCDNPPCVNPNHLYLGTKKDNARDREARGRSNRTEEWHQNLIAGKSNAMKSIPRGSKHYMAKLNESQVLAIRYAYANKEYSMYRLAKIYKMSAAAIFNIIKRKTWVHI